MPYDQFVRWQLAGDEFAPENPLAWRPPAFSARAYLPRRSPPTKSRRTRYDALDDMARDHRQGLLGLTRRLRALPRSQVRSDPDRGLLPAALDVHDDRPQRLRRRSRTRAEYAPRQRKVGVASTRRWSPHWKSMKRSNCGRSLPRGWERRRRRSPRPHWKMCWTADVGEIARRRDVRTAGRTVRSGRRRRIGARDQYTITREHQRRQITALRLEALAHPSMVKGGPGRADNGNFGLSDITVTATSAAARRRPVKMAEAEATFEQNEAGLSMRRSLDDNPSTGWAVDPQFGKDHAAVFTFAEPLTCRGRHAHRHARFQRQQPAQHRPAAAGDHQRHGTPSSTTRDRPAEDRRSRCTSDSSKLHRANSRTRCFEWWIARRIRSGRSLTRATSQTHQSTKPEAEDDQGAGLQRRAARRAPAHARGRFLRRRRYILERGDPNRRRAWRTQAFCKC